MNPLPSPAMGTPSGPSQAPPSGILLIDKPAGVTSFKVVDHVRRTLIQAHPQLKIRGRRGRGGRPPRFKCGHAGTLDPLATGLLVVLVGPASRLSHFLLGLDKSYGATVRFGTETDSLDSDGQVVGSAPVPEDGSLVSGALPAFRGEVLQVPPLISALKQDGQALYKKVRSGQEVEPPPARKVTIHRLDLQDLRWPGDEAAEETYEADLLVECGSGTYIRSLARDLARAVGTVGHIRALRRLTVGPFRVEDALQDVMTAAPEQLVAALQPAAAALPQVPTLVLDEDQQGAVGQGTQPLPEWLAGLSGPPVSVGKAGLLFKMVSAAGRLVAVGRMEELSDGQEPGELVPRLAMVIPGTSEGGENCG